MPPSTMILSPGLTPLVTIQLSPWLCVVTNVRDATLLSGPTTITVGLPRSSRPTARCGTSIAFACVPWGFEIWAGEAHVSLGAVGFLAACAVCSTVMLISMRVHDGRTAVREKADEIRQADVAEVRAAVEETVPAAIDRAMPQVLKDLAAAPDPYEPN